MVIETTVEKPVQSNFKQRSRSHTLRSVLKAYEGFKHRFEYLKKKKRRENRDIKITENPKSDKETYFMLNNKSIESTKSLHLSKDFQRGVSEPLMILIKSLIFSWMVGILILS